MTDIETSRATEFENTHAGNDKYNSIRDWIVIRLSTRLAVPASMIDIDVPVTHFGLDSVAAVDLVFDLEEFLGITLDPMLIHEFKTVKKISEYLVVESGKQKAKV